jgi:hypothetical protein
MAGHTRYLGKRKDGTKPWVAYLPDPQNGSAAKIQKTFRLKEEADAWREDQSASKRQGTWVEAGPDRWQAIESDLGALVNFFELVVLHDQLPALNYPDTFDRPDVYQTGEFRDRLGDMLNAEGDKTLVHVDVEHYLYREAKKAALDQLGRRMEEGPFVPPATADEIPACGPSCGSR